MLVAFCCFSQIPPGTLRHPDLQTDQVSSHCLWDRPDGLSWDVAKTSIASWKQLQKSTMVCCVLVLSRPTEAWTYSLKYFEMYPKRILQMLQPTTLPSRTVSRSMRMGRTLQNYRTSLAFISFLFFFEVLSSRTETSAPWRDWLRSPWSQFRIVKWRQMHSNAARVGRLSNDTVGDTGIKASYSSTYSAWSIGADQFECLMSRFYSCDSCDMLATRNGMCSARLWNDLSAILEAKCHVQIPNNNVTLCATAVPDVKLEYPT